MRIGDRKSSCFVGYLSHQCDASRADERDVENAINFESECGQSMA